jgi:hypothetical protein
MLIDPRKFAFLIGAQVDNLFLLASPISPSTYL